MEITLLWASCLLGVLVFVSAFLTRREPAGTGAATPPPTGEAFPSALRGLALALPLIGLLLTLPASGPFSSGQGLGRGFFIGGVASLLAFLPLWRGGRLIGRDLLAGPYGMGATAVALTLLFLRGSVLDSLMGVAIGWFSIAFTLYLGLSEARRAESGTAIASATGFALTVAAGALIGTLREPSTGSLSKQSWSTALVTFAAFGSVLLYGASFLPRTLSFGLPATRLVAVFAVGALALYQLSAKIVAEPRFWYIGVGGMLLGPVAMLVLRDAARRSRLLPNALPSSGLPLLAVLLATSGFLVAFQMLQAFGASVVVLAMVLIFPVTFSLPSPTETANSESDGLDTAMVTLLLFATGLLLYRLFVARWAGMLRGVTLTDQYALFGLLIGAALPSLLSAAPLRLLSANGASSLLTLALCGALTLLAPGAIILLFGAKCALALLLGLALGVVQMFVSERTGATGQKLSTGFFPVLLALGVALALDQWTGLLMPAVADLTRAAKVRWLVGLMAGLVVLLFAADRVNAASARSEEK